MNLLIIRSPSAAPALTRTLLCLRKETQTNPLSVFDFHLIWLWCWGHRYSSQVWTYFKPIVTRLFRKQLGLQPWTRAVRASLACCWMSILAFALTNTWSKLTGPFSFFVHPLSEVYTQIYYSVQCRTGHTRGIVFNLKNQRKFQQFEIKPVTKLHETGHACKHGQKRVAKTQM